MAGAVGFILNTAGLFVPLAIEASANQWTAGESTSVQIILGSGGDNLAGGNVPHIAVWDNDGNRVGQYHPGAKAKIHDGGTAVIAVPNNENSGKEADPYYVMLSQLGNDAICIAAVTVGNDKVSATLYGDTGVKCGMSWFVSDNKIGSNFQKPKCVWLDGDHTGGINARALSFHLNDMAPSTDKLDEYQQRPKTLCDSTPRFSFWGNLLPNGVIPFFSPKLEYKPDSSNSGEGSDKHPNLVIDKPEQYNKGVYLHQGEKPPSKTRRDPTRNVKANGSNYNPEHLIITSHPEDDVREVCGHPNSYGWDIASTVQNVYCDMEIKQLYSICNGNQFKDNCFDLDLKVIVPKGGVDTRDEFAAAVPHKAYKSVAQWGK